ncbi:MAG: hypothetical protein WAP35_07490 [Solirubrobacterales bacterium]
MNVDLLELAAATLDDLTEEVVFVGAATLALWLTDPAARPPEVTLDIDVVIEVTARPAMHRFEERLRSRGFAPDSDSDLICRWKHQSTDLSLDVMPTDERVLGFASYWQKEAFPRAVPRQLRSGRTVNCASPPYMLAMKLEAFGDRGNNDFLGAKDFADIVTLIDGREEILQEVDRADERLKTFVANEISEMVKRRRDRFLTGLHGAVLPDAASQQRVELVLLPRFEMLASMA